MHRIDFISLLDCPSSPLKLYGAGAGVGLGFGIVKEGSRCLLMLRRSPVPLVFVVPRVQQQLQLEVESRAYHRLGIAEAEWQ